MKKIGEIRELAPEIISLKRTSTERIANIELVYHSDEKQNLDIVKAMLKSELEKAKYDSSKEKSGHQR